ncbi:hypothetical protein A3Q56_03116 [Intoshia linei]|uniref:BEACH domain-containing protein n=1 Tax=Intoshia linei TaxID=1819745 RepID=A0A177B6B6_9BILA|nr:hypothetical protein A3Q56_03116 [Intoshia linei]
MYGDDPTLDLPLALSQQQNLTAKNRDCFEMFQKIFLMINDDRALRCMLDVINHIFFSDNMNYFILEGHTFMVSIFSSLSKHSEIVQKAYFKILMGIMVSLKHIPVFEIAEISKVLVNEKNKSIVEMSLKYFKEHLIKNIKFRSSFRTYSIYLMILDDIFINNENNFNIAHYNVNNDLFTIVVDIASISVTDCKHNAEYVYTVYIKDKKIKKYKKQDARLIGYLLNFKIQIAASIENADLLKSTLIFNIQSSMNNLVDQTMTLETIRIVSSAYINALCNANTKKLFRYSYMFDTFFHIFDWIINLLNDLCIDKNNDQFEEIIPRILYTIFCIFSTFAAAIRNDLGNSYFFQQCNGYQKLTDIIVKLHFFQETDTTVRNEKIKPNSKKVQMIANIFNDVTSQGTNLHTYVFINILINFYYLMLDRFRRHSEYIQQFEPTKNQNWRVYLKNYMSFVQKGKDNLVYNTSASKHIIILIARVNLSYDSRVSLYTYFFHIISNICIKKSNIERFVAVNLSETILLHFGYILFEPKNPVYTVFRSIVVKLLSLDFSENNLRFLLRSQLYDCIDSEFVKSLNSPHIHDIYTNRKITKPYGYLFINGHDYVSNILCNIFYDIIQQRRNYYDKDANLSFMYTVIDSSFDGKANIYLPSVAPKIVRPATSSFLGDDEHILLGGVGSEERVFPPIRGLSFSSWFMFVPDNSKSNIFNMLNIEYINYLTNSAKFSKMIIDNSIPPFNAFSLNFNKMTYELTIATSHSKGNNNHPSDIVRYGAVFCCSNYIKPYAWNHLVIVFQKNQLSRYGDLLLYLNGAFVDKRKLRYIAPFPINSLTSVNAYIGNNVQKPFNGIPNDINIWKQGPVYLFEELLSADMVYDIYKMKQAYVGCFREYSSLNNTDLDSKIIFGLNNISNSFITLKAIRTIYNIYDSVLISSRIKLNSEDSTIPLFYLSNLAINTQGQSKSLGGFYIGNCGIYSVFSRSFHSSLVSCGGCKIFLALIAMSNSNDSFCSSIRLLRESLINNSVLLTDFSKNNGFQILAYIVKRKKQFITVNEVEMLFSLVTSNISDPNNIMIYNLRFFEDLLYDFDTWFSLKPFVTNYYFNLFEQLINCQQYGMQNHLKMKSINTLRRIFSHFLCSKFSISLLETLLSFLFVYLKNFTGHSTTISFCQFIISLVNLSVDENEIDRLEDSDEVKRKQTEIVHIRERCISLILRCITNSKQTELAIENFIMCAGFNFMFVLMNENIISTTRVLSLRLLVQICLSSLAYTRFIDKRLNGKCYDKNSLTFFGHKKLKSFFNDFPTKAEVTSVQSKISNVGGYNILHYITSYYENITPDFYFYLFHLSMQSSPGHFNEKKLTKSFLLSSKFNDHLFFDSIDTYKFWRLTPILLINLKIQTAGINYMLYTLYKEFGCTCTSHYSVLESACEIFSAYIETFKKSNCFVNFIMNHVFIQSLSFTLSFNTTNVFPFKHNSQCLFDVDEYEDVDKEYVFDNVLYAPIVFGIELMIGVLQSVFERLSLQESIAYVDSSLDIPKPESIRNLSLLKKYYETFFDKFINIIVQKGYWVKYKSSTVFSKLLSTKNMSSIISYISNKFVDLIVVQSIEISLDIVFDKICKLFIMYKSENLQIISSHDHKFNLYYAAQRLILYQLSKNILDNRIYNNVIQSLTQIYSYDFIILDEICIDKFYITFYFCLWKIITLCEEESHCLLLPNTYLLNLESSKKENLVQQCKTLFIQKETAIKSELNNFVCQKYLVSIDFENTNLVDLKLSDSIIKVLKNQKDMFRAINTVEKIEPDNKKPIQRKLFQTVFSNVKRISNKNIKIGSIVRHDNKINRYLEFFAFNPQAYCNELVIKQKFAHQWLSFQNKIIIEDAIQSIEHIKNEWKNKEYEMLRNGTIMGQTTNTNLEKYTRSEISVRLGMNFIKEHHCNFYEQYPFLANRKNSIKVALFLYEFVKFVLVSKCDDASILFCVFKIDLRRERL